MDYPYTNQLLYVKRNVINVLLRNSNSEPFKIPVNPEVLHVPQYPKLIKCPMDFGTIKTKLDKQMYQTANECKNDFLDVFRNCYIFNEPGSLYVEMALKLENLFKRKMADLPVPEHYVQDSALHTPKSNKLKKGKSLKLHNLPVKPKLPSNISTNQLNKPEILVNQKRSRSESNNGVVKDEPSSKRVKLGFDFKSCQHIVLSLMSKKYNDMNRYFLEPVDVEGLKLHDYFDIVKKPMDLGTVKRKLSEDCYHSNEEFYDEMKLIFKNCYLYNPEGHEVHRCGKLLEAVFLKLYQSAFATSLKHTPKPIKAQFICEDLQPLLQKILKRQSEIDALHLSIIKRNREIQQSIDYINNTELIKSFKASVNLNHKSSTTMPANKKSTSNLAIYESKASEKTFSPKPSSVKPKVELKTENNSAKFNSTVPVIPQRSVDTSKSPKHNPVKQETAREPTGRFSESKRTIKPTFKSQQSSSCDDTPKPSTTRRTLNHTSNHVLTENGINSSESASTPKPLQKSSNQIETSKTDNKKTPKNSDEYNARLKEIKTWISSLTPEMGMKVREFINKSENKNVVSVSLLKLKPVTINGLYKMMTEPPLPSVPTKESVNEPISSSSSLSLNLKEFTIEDRMQLSQDLRLLGEKCSEKILNIYKKTEDVQSSDGECEIDFQTMKLVTLHSLREFADKCLQKRRAKQLSKCPTAATSAAVGINGADSDSDSSDSSDSDASDSNSESTSSSDNEFFNNLQPTVPVTVPQPSPLAKTTPLEPVVRPVTVVDQNPVDHGVVDSTQDESRLSESSDDSDKDDDDDDDKSTSTPKRPIYSTLWQKPGSNVVSSAPALDSSKKSPISKPESLSKPHPIYDRTTNNQLSESLRQIVKDAQASENVKKHEEELKQVRMKHDEEQKKQEMLKIQALNESRKHLHHSENQKKEEDLIRLKESSVNDRRQRASEIPCVPEREDYHQILCDFEYNINQDLIIKLVHLDQKQFHF